MRYIWIIFSLLPLSIHCLIEKEFENQPLVFYISKSDPHRVKIFWQPSVSVKLVKEIASRDVNLIAKHDKAGEYEEQYGEWRSLVTSQDSDDGKKRYVFLKKNLCDEVDWRVSWIDENGLSHRPIIQRLGPSPLLWAPAGSVSISTPSYHAETDTVILNLRWTITEERIGQPKLTDIRPIAELESCTSYFSEQLTAPTTNLDGSISLAADYARHHCSLWIRLETATYNSEQKCRDLQQSRDDLSTSIDLKCEEIPGMTCSPNKYYSSTATVSEGCEVRCKAFIQSEAAYRYDYPYAPEPYIRISWFPPNKHTFPLSGYLVRHVQVDMSYLNFPLKQYNATVERFNASENSIILEQYTRDPEASYGIQVCTLYTAHMNSCDNVDVNWKHVPQMQVKFNKLIFGLPPPDTPKPSNSSTSFHEEAFTTPTTLDHDSTATVTETLATTATTRTKSVTWKKIENPYEKETNKSVPTKNYRKQTSFTTLTTARVDDDYTESQVNTRGEWKSPNSRGNTSTDYSKLKEFNKILPKNNYTKQAPDTTLTISRMDDYTENQISSRAEQSKSANSRGNILPANYSTFVYTVSFLFLLSSFISHQDSLG